MLVDLKAAATRHVGRRANAAERSAIFALYCAHNPHISPVYRVDRCAKARKMARLCARAVHSGCTRARERRLCVPNEAEKSFGMFLASDRILVALRFWLLCGEKRGRL